MNLVDDYIQKFPMEIQVQLKEVRETIQKAAPRAEETINYGIPTFKLNGNLVHFAGFKNHIGFYPSPSGLRAFKKEISNYKNSKGSVQFPFNKEIPHDLIRKIVEFRVRENLSKG